MSERTNIEWAAHTGGPFLVCSKVSAGCANCYAWAMMLSNFAKIVRAAYQRAGFADWKTRPVWGEKAPRVVTKGFWTDAKRIDQEHMRAGTRGRWFPSLIDWLDKMPAGVIDQEGRALEPVQVRADFLRVVFETEHLDWLLLTKRMEQFRARLEEVSDWVENRIVEGKKSELALTVKPAADLALTAKPSAADRRFLDWLNRWLDGEPPRNVWLGVSVEGPEQEQRMEDLLNVPAAVRFVSAEPLLKRFKLPKQTRFGPAVKWMGKADGTAALDWFIFGLESGKGRRDCEGGIEPLTEMAEECVAFGVPVFVKQDLALHPGTRGRIPERIWKLKQFPR